MSAQAGDGIESPQSKTAIEEGLERSRVLVLSMSANAFGSDWAQLESGTFRFRDPLNKERRFLPLRLDNAPIKGSLAQFLYINWLSAEREQEYAKLLEACRPLEISPVVETEAAPAQVAEEAIQLDYKNASVDAFAFSPDGTNVLTGADDNTLRLWSLPTGKCRNVFETHSSHVHGLSWSSDLSCVLSGGLNESTVYLQDVESGQCLKKFRTQGSSVVCLAWSLDEQQAVFGSGGEGTLEVWNIKTERCIHVLKGHTDFARSVAWSEDGRFVFSAAQDKRYGNGMPS